MSLDHMEGVSQRSLKLMKGPLSYIGTFLRASKDLWSDSNPEGWIPLVVAENKLSNELVLEKLEAVKDYPTFVMNYTGMKGIPQLQAALARLMEHTFVKGLTINPDHVCISSGCSAILDNLFYVICEEGDGVLIPAPYYPAFDNDLTAKNNLHTLPFYLTEAHPVSPDGGATNTATTVSNGNSGSNGDERLSVEQQLDAAVAKAAARGIPVRALLVTNPNNPLGIIYSDATVRAMVGWCLKHKVHYVSDEIYACSIYKPAPTPFISALSIAQQLVQPPAPSTSKATAATDGDSAALQSVSSSEAPCSSSNGTGGGAGEGLYSQREVDTYVHLIYGLSKDWCGSGLRVGLLYSRNQPLQQALESIVLFASVSNYVQWSLAQVLGDLDWADAFLRTNCALLERSYDTLAGVLRDEGIPFLPAVGGMFVWVDLRQWLSSPTWEGEAQLWNGVCDNCKVILTPGEACHAPEPGFFRLCFAWVPPEALAVAAHRLARQLRGGGAHSIV